MPDKIKAGLGAREEEALRGTTLRVYRFIYRRGGPTGIHEIQMALRMASPSTAHYHVEKLLESGLIRADGNGYVVDRLILGNFVRIWSATVPMQAALTAFFATGLAFLVLARPSYLNTGYVLGLVICGVALVYAMLETITTQRQIP